METFTNHVRCHLIGGHRGALAIKRSGQIRTHAAPWPDPRQLPWPDLSITPDAETTTDAEQRILFCGYVVGMGERIDPSKEGQGIAYSEDLSESDKRRIIRWCDAHAYTSMPLRDFLKKTFTDKGFRHDHRVVTPGGRIFDHMRGVVQGFNLPFDLAAGAASWVEVEHVPSFYGGYTFTMATYEKDGKTFADRYTPPIRLKKLPNGAMFGFGDAWNSHPTWDTQNDRIPEGVEHHERFDGYSYGGRFLDVRTLAEALRNKTFSLETACAAFGVPYTKRKVELGKVSDDLLAYCLEDTRATFRLCRAVLKEYFARELPASPDRIQSGASLAKGALCKMSLTRAPDVVPGWAPESAEETAKLAGLLQAAWYARVAECRIRKTLVPCAYVDFRSAFAHSFVLHDIWHLVSAERIVAEDATEAARRLLEAWGLPELLDPASWRSLGRIVCEVAPDGDLLPVRIHAKHGAHVRESGTYEDDHDDQLTELDIVSGAPGYWPLSVLFAAKIRHPRHKAPTILSAVELRGEGVRELTPIKLHGILDVDPNVTDPVRAALMERARRGSDDLASDALKLFANNVGYGLWAEERFADRHPRATTAVKVRAYYGPVAPERGEAPGDPVHSVYYCPGIAALVCGGTQLFMALLDRLACDRGGLIANAITDSAAIIATEQGGELIPCPNGPETLPDGRGAVRALSWADVDTIRATLRSLSVSGEDFLRLQPENFDREGRRRALGFYGVATNRYCLTDYPATTVVKGSLHALGIYENPIKESGPEAFAKQAWEQILIEDGILSSPLTDPAWLEAFVVQRRQVTSPTELDLLEPGGVIRRPFSFTTELARPHEAFGRCYAGLPLPVYDRIARVGDGRFVDAETGLPVRVVTPAAYAAEVQGAFRADEDFKRQVIEELRGEPWCPEDGCTVEEERIYVERLDAWYDEHGEGEPDEPETIVGYTWRELLHDYAAHPERKLLGPNGERSGVGLLTRPTARITAHVPITRTGAVLGTSAQEAETLAWLRSLDTTRIRELLDCQPRMARYVKDGSKRPAPDLLGYVAAAHQDDVNGFFRRPTIEVESEDRVSDDPTENAEEIIFE